MVFGTPEQKERFVKPILKGEKRICLGEYRACFPGSIKIAETTTGITEASGGSDVANILTTATRTSDGKGWRVTGSKKVPLSLFVREDSLTEPAKPQWITNCLFSDYMTTAVRTGPPGSGAKGISVMVIDLNQPGVTRRKIENSGVNASGSTYVELEDVL